ncbi:cysteine and histidine-rich domain-containing protein RAR1 [Selaginella moellendorffii]|uniref:cysteine and histidine-rich domain-containing protein RAR1 n=1 Tax=Selaginella moellendorffii TaxID=88036 RepID=UPI000D1C933E|nr:cysteine and histidine-rich domain-containing protein RAR1 [Selaginella moellendorffii]|eukprot:XP_024537285.1 cysteine and histidine-rich domain-containing protein RAR1 [Selaginella moellendorffii]
MGKVQCQRIGCDALFSPDQNDDENACCYHPGPPLFHDGGKQWSCCKQQSHDFSLFLSIPGCTHGKHTSEKPKPAPKSSKTVPQGDASNTNCLRCKQGFYCSDHGSKISCGPVAAPSKDVEKPAAKEASQSSVQAAPAALSNVIDLDAKRTCRNKGCGKAFTERENHETACSYHPGPAVFHDRSRGWACCDVHVKEFDEFLEIPPCSKGWHSSQ